MKNALRSPEDYELFIYSLSNEFPQLKQSTLVFIRIGASMAKVTGELFLDNGIRISVRERLVFDRLPVVIDSYSYEVWKNHEKLIWYDPQPHPDVPDLQSSFPHHKHIHPDIKHNRMVAPEISFDSPNLPIIITEATVLIEP